MSPATALIVESAEAAPNETIESSSGVARNCAEPATDPRLRTCLPQSPTSTWISRSNSAPAAYTQPDAAQDGIFRFPPFFFFFSLLTL